MEISATELQPGTFLQNGSYTVLTSLGHGGFGNTYIARQTALQRDVAIKEFFMKDSCVRDKDNNVLPSGDEGSVVSSYKSKFLKEARTIATLNNPHVVHIYDVFEENNTVYYVMELLKGGSLKELVSRHGPLSEERAVRYVVQIAEALYYIHKQGYVHLDVKPANIMLNDFGEAVLIDFGVSKHFSGNGSTTSALYGVSEAFSFHTFESALDHTYDRLDMLENRDSEKKMGTTMTLLMFCAEGAFAAHIGDSRIYHIRPSETGSARIRFVTSDHSLVNELVAVGVMSKEEASHSSRRNILTKAMMPFQCKRDKPSCTFIHDVRPRDYFFMCSDGMLENLDDNDIANILSMELAEGDKTKLFRRMTASNDDNHSAYIIKVLSVSPE